MMAYTTYHGMLILYEKDCPAEHNIDLTARCWKGFYGSLHEYDEWPVRLKEVNLCLY